MCCELYDEKRVAKNLLCGHTCCLICLDTIYLQKLRIECPLCRLQHDPSI